MATSDTNIPATATKPARALKRHRPHPKSWGLPRTPPSELVPCRDRTARRGMLLEITELTSSCP